MKQIKFNILLLYANVYAVRHTLLRYSEEPDFEHLSGYVAWRDAWLKFPNRGVKVLNDIVGIETYNLCISEVAKIIADEISSKIIHIDTSNRHKFVLNICQEVFSHRHKITNLLNERVNLTNDAIVERNLFVEPLSELVRSMNLNSILLFQFASYVIRLSEILSQDELFDLVEKIPNLELRHHILKLFQKPHCTRDLSSYPLPKELIHLILDYERADIDEVYMNLTNDLYFLS